MGEEKQVSELFTKPPLACLQALEPGSAEEIQCFKKTQANFRSEYASVFPDPMAPKTIVIIPSMTLDPEILCKINGHVYYEERMLCLLMLLRMPNTHVVFVSSVPVDPVIIDYYLHLLPGITGYHARKRLSLLSCYDAGTHSLTSKILDRPRLMWRIKSAIPPGHIAHIACFTVTPLERTLAVQLGLPIYGCDPDLAFLGNKSRGRQLFKEYNLLVPDGFEDLHNLEDMLQALTALKLHNPDLRKAVIKMNDGFSGDGNAIFSYEDPPFSVDPAVWIREQFHHRIKIVAAGMGLSQFIYRFNKMQGIVEAFIEGEIKTSPSVQYRINPLGNVDIISTHDQRLGGESGQVFLGADFPASPEYSREIGQIGKKVAAALRDKGVLGRFSVDYLSVKEKGQWKNYAIEINLRKGGTTHPYLMLQFLTNGNFDSDKALYLTASGQPRYYYATDNLSGESYRGLTPPDLIDIAMSNDLHYDATHQEGVMFHLIGALSQYGKLGVVCIGASPDTTLRIFENTVKALNRS